MGKVDGDDKTGKVGQFHLRFLSTGNREVYYWDSYWIIRGLLLCDMGDTVRGMLKNFVHFIEKLGKIPNGGRTYFENRSQPPLFIQMVEEYVEATGDMQFVR